MTNDRNSDRIERATMRISLYSIIVNLTLSFLKLAVGIAASSGAMVSDAIHSAADVFSVFIVVIGVKMANKSSDEEHPYGHERLECAAAIILSVVLGITGGVIGYHGIVNVFGTKSEKNVIPGIAALVVSVIAIVVKEGMYWYIKTIAKSMDSSVLMAEAWHHRTDALASFGGFIGIMGARMGIAAMDPAASVVISLFIIKAAIDIFMDAIRKMIDVSCDDKTVKTIHQIAEAQKGVIHVAEVKTRLFGNKKYVDIAVCADGTKSLEETHAMAEEIHRDIEEKVEGVKHCMVYVSPVRKEDEDWQR